MKRDSRFAVRVCRNPSSEMLQMTFLRVSLLIMGENNHMSGLGAKRRMSVLAATPEATWLERFVYSSGFRT